MFKLRTYQQEAVDAGLKYLNGNSKKPGIIIVPCGGGKSIIISYIAKEVKGNVLVLQPSKEILMQNYGKAVSFGATPTIYSASCKKKEISEFTYATLKSIKKDVERLKEIGVDVIICDEVHAGYSAEEKSEFMEFVKHFPKAKVLGFTATPCRLRTFGSLAEGNYSQLNFLTKDIPRFFDKVIHVTQVEEVVDLGFWSDIEYEVWKFDDSALRLNSTGAEYTVDSIKESIRKNGVNNTIYKRIIELMDERKHILVCMDSTENCRIISEFMNKKYGRITDYVTNETSGKQRDKIIEEFKDGKLKVVFNYAALSTGFDFPDLDCVIFGRPTFSFSVYYQVLGRVVRPSKNKENGLIVDCCDNYSRFGDIRRLSIEDVPYRGWTMFSGDNVISNLPMGNILTRKTLEEAAERRRNKEINGGGNEIRRRSDMDSKIMHFGKYEGVRLRNIPVSYWKFLYSCEELSKDKREFVERYYRDIFA